MNFYLRGFLHVPSGLRVPGSIMCPVSGSRKAPDCSGFEDIAENFGLSDFYDLEL